MEFLHHICAAQKILQVSFSLVLILGEGIIRSRVLS